MKLGKILSDRKIQLWPSWQIVYEWEDILSKDLNIPITYVTGTENVMFKVFRRLKLLKYIQWLSSKSKVTAPSLYFEMYADKNFSYGLKKNIIPVIIDFFLKKEELPEFHTAHQNCDLILISSLEAFNFLKTNNSSLNIQHFPLSISDNYRLTENSHYKKDIDVLMAGRKNPVIWEYLQRYSTENKEFEYVYQINVDGKLMYESNKKGVIGEFHSREEYIDLLRSAKISFYATPGVDGGEERTNGFNPVTPRFLELMTAGCLLMGRYPINAETEFYELEEYCPRIESYEEFINILENYNLLDSYPKEKYIKYLDKHYTSVRAKQLENIFK